MNEFLESYYIVDRVNNVTYTPTLIVRDKNLIAYSNVGTDTKPFVIDIVKLKKGLAEKRYRLRERAEYFI